jgi:hypothetical protein
METLVESFFAIFGARVERMLLLATILAGDAHFDE